MSEKFETKYLGGFVKTKEVKTEHRNGVPIGILEGYIATWDIDQPDFFGERDRFVKGAFTESLRDHRDRDKRQIRLKSQHDELIGGFPIDTVKEDDIGLFAIGEVNLNVPLGASRFALAKQGVLVDLSIGFIVEDFDTDNDLKLRTIKRARVIEGSIVDEPRNQNAKILSVKNIDLDAANKCLCDDCELEQKDIDDILTIFKEMIEDKRVTPFLDLPLAPSDRVWDASAAIKRVRTLTGSEDEPSQTYRRAFLWWDSDEPDEFGSYKMPYADVINGKLTAVPRGLNNAKARLNQTDIPASDKTKVLVNIERYQDKLEDEDDDKAVVVLSEVKNIQSLKEIEVILQKAGFSDNAANALISKVKELKSSDQGDLGTGGDGDQGDLENIDEVLLQLKAMNESYVDSQIAHEIKQLGRSVENV